MDKPELLRRLADAIERAESQTEEVAAALAIFGRDGIAVIAALERAVDRLSAGRL